MYINLYKATFLWKRIKVNIILSLFVILNLKVVAVLHVNTPIYIQNTHAYIQINTHTCIHTIITTGIHMHTHNLYVKNACTNSRRLKCKNRVPKCCTLIFVCFLTLNIHPNHLWRHFYSKKKPMLGIWTSEKMDCIEKLSIKTPYYEY